MPKDIRILEKTLTNLDFTQDIDTLFKEVIACCIRDTGDLVYKAGHLDPEKLKAMKWQNVKTMKTNFLLGIYKIKDDEYGIFCLIKFNQKYLIFAKHSFRGFLETILKKLGIKELEFLNYNFDDQSDIVSTIIKMKVLFDFFKHDFSKIDAFNLQLHLDKLKLTFNGDFQHLLNMSWNVKFVSLEALKRFMLFMENLFNDYDPYFPNISDSCMKENLTRISKLFKEIAVSKEIRENPETKKDLKQNKNKLFELFRALHSRGLLLEEGAKENLLEYLEEKFKNIIKLKNERISKVESETGERKYPIYIELLIKDGIEKLLFWNKLAPEKLLVSHINKFIEFENNFKYGSKYNIESLISLLVTRIMNGYKDISESAIDRILEIGINTTDKEVAVSIIKLLNFCKSHLSQKHIKMESCLKNILPQVSQNDASLVLSLDQIIQSKYIAEFMCEILIVNNNKSLRKDALSVLNSYNDDILTNETKEVIELEKKCLNDTTDLFLLACSERTVKNPLTFSCFERLCECFTEKEIASIIKTIVKAEQKIPYIFIEEFKKFLKNFSCNVEKQSNNLLKLIKLLITANYIFIKEIQPLIMQTDNDEWILDVTSRAISSKQEVSEEIVAKIKSLPERDATEEEKQRLIKYLDPSSTTENETLFMELKDIILNRQEELKLRKDALEILTKNKDQYCNQKVVKLLTKIIKHDRKISKCGFSCLVDILLSDSYQVEFVDLKDIIEYLSITDIACGVANIVRLIDHHKCDKNETIKALIDKINEYSSTIINVQDEKKVYENPRILIKLFSDCTTHHQETKGFIEGEISEDEKCLGLADKNKISEEKNYPIIDQHEQGCERGANPIILSLDSDCSLISQEDHSIVGLTDSQQEINLTKGNSLMKFYELDKDKAGIYVNNKRNDRVGNDRVGLKEVADEVREILTHKMQLSLGSAVDDGDCFFDSIAQLLNRELNHNESIETLRSKCSQYTGDWVEKEIEKDILNLPHEQYKIQIQNTSSMALAKKLMPIWGRLDIEGKIICSYFKGLKIVVIEIFEGRDLSEAEEELKKNMIEIFNQIQTFNIVDSNSTSKSVTRDDDYIKDKNVIFLACKGLHFIPLFKNCLDKKLIQQPQDNDEKLAQILQDEELAHQLSITDQINLSIAVASQLQSKEQENRTNSSELTNKEITEEVNKQAPIIFHSVAVQPTNNNSYQTSNEISTSPRLAQSKLMLSQYDCHRSTAKSQTVDKEKPSDNSTSNTSIDADEQEKLEILEKRLESLKKKEIKYRDPSQDPKKLQQIKTQIDKLKKGSLYANLRKI